ncbi:dihydroorotate oxidase B, catalytic subunit [Ignisphaera aggregans DSM 17230]|uniref:Dihydroorotate dehydrogenase n=1 Tax=Ignisphaera aggregans (strain DSM 17230 / JCM 13409 / AQ1.S1) TaxID=583356 RepID=E0SQF1_IGNAA|nr:dihydroorotate oxidase B, catalytic subunit [Ignisphaera aggregans DSM 17230]
MSLETIVAGIVLKHPIMNASGILGEYREHIARLARYGFSAIVTKTITPSPRKGYEPPIIVELPNGGLLNAVGLANPGKGIVYDLVNEARKYSLPIIISIGGSSEREFIEVASLADEFGANGIELNLSCPHAKGYGIEIGADPSSVYSIVKEVSSVVKIPIIAKLGLCDRVVESSIKALSGGARALTLINTVKAMAIDVYTMKPILSNIFGGLSGPPIHPIAVRIVYEVYRETEADIIGCGGVDSWESAAEFFLAGAKAVQIGTAIYRDENIVNNIVQGLQQWLYEIGAKSIRDIVGAAHKF